MSQAGRPRPRYIAFKIHGTPLSRRQLDKIIAKATRELAHPPRLTRFEHPHAIVWADHRMAREVISSLEGVTNYFEAATTHDIRLEPLLVSGTIKRLTTRLGVLRDRPPKPEKKAKAGNDGRSKVKPTSTPKEGGTVIPGLRRGRGNTSVAPPKR